MIEPSKALDGLDTGEKLQGAMIRLAENRAAEAIRRGDPPYGAVIAVDGEVIVAERNRVLSSNDPTAHAEFLAIREACRRLGTTDLQGATLYATCEPCSMCLAAIRWASIRTVIFGASDSRFGAFTSQVEFYTPRMELLETPGCEYLMRRAGLQAS